MKIWISALSVLIATGLRAQLADTLEIDEVMVTATRTERSVARVPMPVSVVTEKEIKTLGSARLQDILSQQTGLQVVPQVNGLGNGLQLQGLNPDYIMILIDGEPLIGRYAGSLELNRITAHNIKKIEIVKGPSSSLYGSEALGGVINIITQKPETSRASAMLRCGSFHTIDAAADVSLATDRFKFFGFANFYNTQGYDFDNTVFGQTVSPFSNYTLQSRITHSWSARSEFNVNARFFHEKQEPAYQVVAFGDSTKLKGNAWVNDFTLHPFYKYKLNRKTYLQAGAYYTLYQTHTLLNEKESNALHYRDTFRQSFIRPEILATCNYSKNQKWTIGIGWVNESVRTLRYGDDDARNQYTGFIYAQHEWELSPKVNVVSGMRLDASSVFAPQWSPKLAVQYTINPRWSLKFSGGRGFKAPDFRYQYLNFRNAAASYSVFGSEVVKNELELLEKQGQILQYSSDVHKIANLNPERSVAFNAGVTFVPGQQWHVDCNFFRNDLQGLIETQEVAITTNFQKIFSYVNVNRAFTQGIELNLQYVLSPRWTIRLGGQYLQAKDKDKLREIEKGLVFGRDPETGNVYRLRKSDYVGLPMRSAHAENIHLTYTDAKRNWDASLRIIHRGRFGTGVTAGSVAGVVRPASDQNSNQILDRFDLFVRAYTLVHLSASKMLGANWRVQLGADNLLNYTDAVNIPTLSGRNLYLALRYTFSHLKCIKNSVI